MNQEKTPSSVYLRRRVVAGVSAAILAVSATAAVESAIESPSSNGAGVTEEIVYPPRSENQLRALPNQDTVTAHTGEGVDGLIAEANPGILNSIVPGSEKVIHELEDVVGSEAPNGVVIDNAQYKVPEVPTAVQQIK